MFRRMDDDGSRGLNLEEFSKGIRETGLELNEEEVSPLQHNSKKLNRFT